MNFSTLIKTLVDYMDVGKRIATTIPGMVLALALVAFFVQPTEFLGQRGIALYATRLQQQQLKIELDRIAAKQKDIVEGKDNQADATLAAIRTQLAKQDIWEQLSSASAGILKQGFFGILFFGMLGFAFGTVLDPINKALFLQAIPELGEKSPRLRAVSGYGVLDDAKKKLETKYQDHPIYQRIQAQDPLKLSAQYFIGRGLISAAEYDDLISKYYVYTQISIGMIIPTLILAISTAYVQSTNLKGSGQTFIWPALLVPALAAAVLLHRVGLRRYGEFRSQVFDLIAGREKAQMDQSEHVNKDEVMHLARAVHKVEQLSGKLEKSVEHSSDKLDTGLRDITDLARRIEIALERFNR